MKKKKNSIDDAEKKIESNVNNEIIDIEEKIQNNKIWYIAAIVVAIIVAIAIFLIVNFI